jgi:hypothetical protein
VAAFQYRGSKIHESFIAVDREKNFGVSMHPIDQFRSVPGAGLLHAAGVGIGRQARAASTVNAEIQPDQFRHPVF